MYLVKTMYLMYIRLCSYIYMYTVTRKYLQRILASSMFKDHKIKAPFWSSMFPLSDGDGGIKSSQCSYSWEGYFAHLNCLKTELSLLCKPFLIWQIRQSKQKLNFSDHLIYFHIILLFIEKQNIIRKLFIVKCIYLFIHFVHPPLFTQK